MALFSWIASSAASGLVKGFGGIFTDLRKMRLDAETAMAQTAAAREKEQLRAQIEVIDKLTDLNQQASNHMQAMMKEWWMKLPMLIIMWCAAIWISAATFRGLYGYGGDIVIADNVTTLLQTVILSMFGLGASVLISNKMMK